MTENASLRFPEAHVRISNCNCRLTYGCISKAAAEARAAAEAKAKAETEARAAAQKAAAEKVIILANIRQCVCM